MLFIMSLAKMTLDGTFSKGDSAVPEQELGTSSVLLSVAPIAPQISASSFQGHQQPSPKTPSQTSDNGRNLAARLAGIEERLGGLMKEVTAWWEDFEQTFIGS
jgi:hypothetical protein